eukprot:gene3221-16794_t
MRVARCAALAALSFPSGCAGRLGGTRLNGGQLDRLRDAINAERNAHGPTARDHLCPQWLRASFHDAGAFDPGRCQGGARGCLLHLMNN